MTALAIARLSYANGMRQAVVWLSAAIGLLLLGLSVLFGMFTFEVDDRMRLLLTAGVAVILLVGLFLGVLQASSTVHEELADRTAHTLLAKPIGRGAFLLGKALGAWAVAGSICLLLALAHLISVALVARYGFDLLDAHEHDGHVHAGFLRPDLAVPWLRLLAADALVLAHTAIITCLATTFALRLGTVANVLLCFGIFVLSNILAGIGWGAWFGGVLPAMPLFVVDESLQFAEFRLTTGYFLLCAFYALLYSSGSLLVGTALLKRQDLT